MQKLFFLQVLVSSWQRKIHLCHKGTKTLSLIYFFTALGFSSCALNDDQLFADSSVVTHGGITYYANKPFTGITFHLDQQGDTVSRVVYRKGKIDGPDLAWYSKGVKKHERYYAQGKKEGVHLGWWPNGNLKFRYTFNKDEYDGTVEEWYEDGRRYRSFTYSMGHEQGSQKMWRPDGNIYANYVVKNNRIYGLSGRKIARAFGKVNSTILYNFNSHQHRGQYLLQRHARNTAFLQRGRLHAALGYRYPRATCS